MNLIPPYFITVTRDEEGPLAGTQYDVNPHFLILMIPDKGGGTRIIINALVFYGNEKSAHLEMRVRESSQEIQQMMDAVHQRAAEAFLNFQAAMSKTMMATTEMLERERAKEMAG